MLGSVLPLPETLASKQVRGFRTSSEEEQSQPAQQGHKYLLYLGPLLFPIPFPLCGKTLLEQNLPLIFVV